MRNFLTERGKIVSSRISGNSARYQRLIAREIKKARAMALLPYLALERRIVSDRTTNDRDRDRNDRSERGSRERRSRVTESAASAV